ncbi:MAG: hypothetical protein JWP14_547 [Frankiales bacterium]|nr:hypothetical protein [Frankiales bacterium]
MTDWRAGRGIPLLLSKTSIMLRPALTVALVLAGSTQVAAATDVPDIAVCAATNLHLSVSAMPLHVSFDDPQKASLYFTNINVFATTVGKGPCYLLGAPRVTLRTHGRDVGGPYTTDETPLLDAAASPTDFVLGPLLLPYRTSHQYGQIFGAWDAPYCGQKSKASLSVHFLSGEEPAVGPVPTPPCRTGNGPRGTHTSAWLIRS